MEINYIFKIKENPDLIINGKSKINLEPQDFIDLSDEEIKTKFQTTIGLDIKSKLENSQLIIEAIDDDNLANFCKQIEAIVEENNKDYIYLSYKSEKGDADWYGDYNYLANPLSKYISCKKQCECYYMDGSSHGYGTAGIVVKTTEDFLNMMGWEDDLKYKTTREEFIRYKK
jgi:hypothetical protein